MYQDQLFLFSHCGPTPPTPGAPAALLVPALCCNVHTSRKGPSHSGEKWSFIPLCMDYTESNLGGSISSESESIVKWASGKDETEDGKGDAQKSIHRLNYINRTFQSHLDSLEYVLVATLLRDVLNNLAKIN